MNDLDTHKHLSKTNNCKQVIICDLLLRPSIRTSELYVDTQPLKLYHATLHAEILAAQEGNRQC